MSAGLGSRADDFTALLLIDAAETRTPMSLVLTETRVPFVVVSLPIGDFLWTLVPSRIARALSGRVLERSDTSLDSLLVSGFIAERKSVGDLYFSIQDGRYENQKLRMLALVATLPTFARRPLYVLEENATTVLKHKPSSEEVPHVTPTRVSNMLVDAHCETLAQGLSVVRVSCIKGTAAWLAASHAIVQDALCAGVRAGEGSLLPFRDYVAQALKINAAHHKILPLRDDPSVDSPAAGDVSAGGASCKRVCPAAVVAVDDDVIIIDASGDEEDVLLVGSSGDEVELVAEPAGAGAAAPLNAANAKRRRPSAPGHKKGGDGTGGGISIAFTRLFQPPPHDLLIHAHTLTSPLAAGEDPLVDALRGLFEKAKALRFKVISARALAGAGGMSRGSSATFASSVFCMTTPTPLAIVRVLGPAFVSSIRDPAVAACGDNAVAVSATLARATQHAAVTCFNEGGGGGASSLRPRTLLLVEGLHAALQKVHSSDRREREKYAARDEAAPSHPPDADSAFLTRVFAALLFVHDINTVLTMDDSHRVLEAGKGRWGAGCEGCGTVRAVAGLATAIGGVVAAAAAARPS